MKKLIVGICALVAMSSMSLLAQEAAAASKENTEVVHREKASWPVWLAFNSTKDIDVVGLRLTLPYGDCEDVTGFDLGIVGHCRYMYGLQVNVLRNDVTDFGGGLQVGVYNSMGRADAFSLQVGLWNEANRFYGAQVGLINVCDEGTGIQVGVVNRAEGFYGFQLGIVNAIRGGEYPFLPVINFGY